MLHSGSQASQLGLAGGIVLWHFRHLLLAITFPSVFEIAAGAALIAVEVYLFARVERELGSRRLVGHAELTGTGQLFSGNLYAYIAPPTLCRNVQRRQLESALLAQTPLHTDCPWPVFGAPLR